MTVFSPYLFGSFCYFLKFFLVLCCYVSKHSCCMACYHLKSAVPSHTLPTLLTGEIFYSWIQLNDPQNNPVYTSISLSLSPFSRHSLVFFFPLHPSLFLS